MKVYKCPGCRHHSPVPTGGSYPAGSAAMLLQPMRSPRSNASDKASSRITNPDRLSATRRA